MSTTNLIKNPLKMINKLITNKPKRKQIQINTKNNEPINLVSFLSVLYLQYSVIIKQYLTLTQSQLNYLFRIINIQFY